MNKKGIVVPPIMGGVFVCMWIASMMLATSHRERQAIKFCQAEKMADIYCAHKVDSMTPEAIMAYIKDDSPTGKRIKEIKDF